jgi:hypothetical protein
MATVNQPPMTAPVGRFVYRMGWMIRLFFIHLFYLTLTNILPQSNCFLAADLWSLFFSLSIFS